MSYVSIDEAGEALQTTFPGAKVSDKVQTWGWEVHACIWHFKVCISNLSGKVRVTLEENVPKKKGRDKVFVREEITAIGNIADLNRALTRVHANLLGLAVGLFQFCGVNE